MNFRKSRSKFLVIYIFLLFFLISYLFNSFFCQSFNKILPENFYTTIEEINNANSEKIFGNIYTIDFENDFLETGEKNEKSGSIIFKLFGVIPIKKIKVEILPDEEVILGGIPIGLNVLTKGVLVVSNTLIDQTTNKSYSNKFLKNGDIILKINNKEINLIEDVDSILNNLNEDTEIELEILRNNKLTHIKMPQIKNKDNECKLGVWVKDDMSGIGTLTFVDSNNNFAALGHPITDSSGENYIPIKEGNVFSCSLLGIEKGKENKPGQLKCLFVKSNENGSILKNTKYGIVGKYNNINDFIDTNLTAKLGGRLSVKPGKAKIISSVSGLQEEYEIEIIKTNNQKEDDDKSLIFRVTDKRLLELTGGIVQGMSGSPIIQNDKIVGAVTHVFVKDPTKGYGVYVDWMLKELKNT